MCKFYIYYLIKTTVVGHTLTKWSASQQALQKVVASRYLLKVLTNTNKSLSESYRVQSMPRDST